MRIFSVILNSLGIILTFAFIIIYFSDMYAMTDHLNSVAIAGRVDNPTSIFYTVKINRIILVLVFTFMAIFVFNAWAFIKKKPEETDQKQKKGSDIKN